MTMNEFQVAYIPIGVPTFHLESAKQEFDKSIEAIKSITEEGIYPDKMLLSIEELKSFLDTIKPDIIILQNITFANSAYVSEILKRFNCPILLWTLREPVIDGGRLRLNSLTGAYSAGNAMKTYGSDFEYIFGSPEEERVKEKLDTTIRAAYLRYSLKKLKMLAVGHTPQGFGFGRALDNELLKTFGVTLDSIEARELMDKANDYTRDELKSYLKEFQQATVGLDKIPEENIEGFLRLYKAYKDYVKVNEIGAVSSRCWPDFFTAYGTPVCAVLSMLNDIGIPTSCESDVYGALSMYMGMKLTNKPTFFGDPVSLDENDNTITFWHCGMASCSLASSDTGARIGVHPNRKIGPVMDFGCKPCKKVTIFRVGRKYDGSFRFFLSEGEAVDKPKQFTGTTVVVKTKNPSIDIVNKSVLDGWEPHFAVIYGDVTKELEVLGNMLDIKVSIY